MFRLVGMEYRYVATSVAGFVQQLVSCYLPHGYWFYVSGIVPKEKDPRSVDRKLLERYGIAISRQSRARRKAAGNVSPRSKREGIITDSCTDDEACNHAQADT